jgi:hypothetical protein
MRKLSYWSRDHKKSARILIVFSYLILNVTGLFLGDLLHSITGTFNPALILIPIILTIVGYISYPQKKNKAAYNNFYITQKLNDCFLIIATFLFIVFTGNKLNENRGWNQSASASSIHYPSSKISLKNKTVNTKPQSGTSVSKNFIERLQTLRRALKKGTGTEKALAIFFVILVSGLALSMVAAASCSLSCSGSEALGTIVLILGIPAIIFGAVKLFQRMTRGLKKPVVEEPLE